MRKINEAEMRNIEAGLGLDDLLKVAGGIFATKKLFDFVGGAAELVLKIGVFKYTAGSLSAYVRDLLGLRLGQPLPNLMDYFLKIF